MVSYGIIGLRGIGKLHAKNIKRLKDAKLTAVSDLNDSVLDAFCKKNEQVKGFTDYKKMLTEGDCDTIIIATPHTTHVHIAIDCLRAGKNIIIEKPLSVTSAEAESLVDELKKYPHLKAAVMYNQRTCPLYAKAKRLIDSGKFGNIQRVQFNVYDWYRPQSYYDKSGWHGTYKGEGGGILIGLITHQLDIMHWLFGLPHSLRADCSTKNRNISAENEVSAIMMYKGYNAVFTASCHELKGRNRLEIVLDKGRIIVGKYFMVYSAYSKSEAEVNKSGYKGFKTCTQFKLYSISGMLKQQYLLLKEIQKSFTGVTEVLTSWKMRAE
jgi:predicted dehydrogenase